MSLIATIRETLENRHKQSWSLQGLGMLRMYLPDDCRLHVWDDRFAVPGVSTLHTHPWDFKSTVVAGVIHNQRYVVATDGVLANAQKILCGTGGGLVGEPEHFRLKALTAETYWAGLDYQQRANEIHETRAERGTVTLIERRPLPDRDHARVFWSCGEQWVSAEPRAATADEIEQIVGYALERWF